MLNYTENKKKSFNTPEGRLGVLCDVQSDIGGVASTLYAIAESARMAEITPSQLSVLGDVLWFAESALGEVIADMEGDILDKND